MYTVYQHKNLRNGKSYIGMTSQNPKERWDSGWGYKNNLRMWSDIQNSDWNKDWEHNIIGQFEDKQEALNAEGMFIWLFDSTNNGYNISSYGNSHFKRSEETLRKMSESRTGEKHPMFGKHFTEEHRRKLSESSHSKPVLQFSKEGDFLAEYSSTKDAGRKTGCRQQSICDCCNEKRKSCGGFIWRYKEI